MRALAFAPKRREVENRNGRLPGGTLVLLAAATPWTIAVQIGTSAMLGCPRFTGFQPGLAQNRRLFASQCRSLFLKQRVPQWHSLNAKRCKGDRDGITIVSKSLFVVSASCLTIDMPLVSVVQSVERVVQRDGPFPWLARQSSN